MQEVYGGKFSSIEEREKKISSEHRWRPDVVKERERKKS